MYICVYAGTSKQIRFKINKCTPPFNRWGRATLYLVIQIKYGLPYCVICPSMRRDPGSLNPGTRRNLIPGGGIPGSVLILGHVTEFRKNTLNLYYYIFSIWTSFELSRPVVVQHLVICPFAQIGLPIVSHVSPETVGWIFSVRRSVELSWLEAVQHLAYLSSRPIWACLWARAPLSETTGRDVYYLIY